MKLWLAMILPLTLLAQESATTQEAKTDKKEEKAAEASPAPQAEKAVSGHIDVGARWVKTGGDFNTYRSMVNLGEGVRLSGLDLTIAPAAAKFMDSLRVQAQNWGGDPYNTARMEIVKKGKYRYNGTYSNIAYFNFLPSFADPTMSKGTFLNQRAFDTSIRNSDHMLELFPGGKIVPYVGYERNSEWGSGITTLVADRTEYPLRNNIRWGQNQIRGGVRLEMNRWHATFEQGATSFKDDQGVYSTERLSGNRTEPYLGQYLFLTQGQQFYRVRGDGPYTKVLLTANPFSWIDLSGQFLRTKPAITSTFNQNAAGNLVSGDLFLFYPRGTDTFFGSANMPRTSGSLSAEIRPFSRLRIRQTWESDDFQSTAAGVLASALTLTGGGTSQSTANATDLMSFTRKRLQTEGLLDVFKSLTVRGGYRYEWGESVLRSGSLSFSGPSERGELKRHVGLAGAQYRPWQKLTLNADAEIGDGVKTYYRTGVMDTQRYRFQGRLNLPKNLLFAAIYSRYQNENPNRDVNLKYKSQTASANLQWLPGGGKNITVIADYTRSAIRSDINYLYPLGLFPLQSLYVDNAHTGTLLTDVRIPMGKTMAGRLSMGGSFVRTAGSRPSQYYQPVGRVQIPVTPKLEFFSEWRYYGLTQAFYTYEGFRSNQFTGGVRFVM